MKAILHQFAELPNTLELIVTNEQYDKLKNTFQFPNIFKISKLKDLVGKHNIQVIAIYNSESNPKEPKIAYSHSKDLEEKPNYYPINEKIKMAHLSTCEIEEVLPSLEYVYFDLFSNLEYKTKYDTLKDFPMCFDKKYLWDYFIETTKDNVFLFMEVKDLIKCYFLLREAFLKDETFKELCHSDRVNQIREINKFSIYIEPRIEQQYLKEFSITTFSSLFGEVQKVINKK